jgi:HEAT repeat protein
MKDPQAVAPLLAALRNEPNLDVRCGAFFALAKIGDPETFPELIRLLRRESDPPLAQHAIIRMLGKIKDSRAIMPLITASLVADEVNIPSDAVKALGNLADPQVESVLIAALENDSAFEVRRSAAALLGKIGGTKAVPVLISAVERDAQNDVKEQAIRSLGLLGDMRALPILTCQLQKGVNIAYASTEAIGAIGDSQSEKDLLEALKGASIPVTAGILQSLGETGGTNGLATLMHWGRSVEHHTICGSVASAMGKIGDARAMPVLEKMLINDSSSVRVEAAMALGHIGDTKAIPLLVERSKTCADEELIAVTFALAELRATNAVEYLNAVMVRSRGRAKLAAACSLAFLSQTNAIPFLDFNLDAKDPWQRFISISGLLYLNRPESMACLKKVLKDKQMGLRQLVSAASEGGASMAMAGLLKDKDADMRYYAARALLLFDNPATLDALEAACKDRDPETRSAARLAFRRIKRMHNHPAGRAESLNRITPSVF